MPQVQTEAHTYEEEFPRYLGPPPVPNYTGKKLHDTKKPLYTVELDSGAFMALWEHMEAEAKFRFPARDTLATARAHLRTVQALRDVYWATHEPPAPPEPPRAHRRRLVRKN